MISRAGNLTRAPALLAQPGFAIYACDKWTRSGRRQVKELADKQKSRSWELQRNRDFWAGCHLEGVEVPLVTPTTAETLTRLEALRRHYK